MPQYNLAGLPKATPGTAAPLPAGRDEKGMPTVESVTSDDPASPLMEMLGPLAHPETLADFARLLTLPVDSVRKAAVSALAMAASRGPAGKALTAAGRGAEKVGTAIETPAKTVGVYEAFTNPGRAAATIATPQALKMVGKGLQKAGAAVSGAEPTLSVAEEAELLKQGYTPQVLAKMRPSGQPGPSMAPSGPSAAPAMETPPAMAPAPMAVPAVKPSVLADAVKAKLTAAETGEYLRLRALGKSDEAAKAALEAGRTLAAKFGLPTGETVRQSVANRNLTGRWPE